MEDEEIYLPENNAEAIQMLERAISCRGICGDCWTDINSVIKYLKSLEDEK